MRKRDRTPPRSQGKRGPRRFDKKRWGSIILLSAGMIVMVFGFLAFSVDVGYIALTKAQLEAATDAGVQAATMELQQGLGEGASMTPDEAKIAATQAAVLVASANRAGDQDSIYVNPSRDVRFGQCTYDPVAGKWTKMWGVYPYNMVELTLHRDYIPPPTGGSSGTPHNNPDGPLPLFFAPVIGHNDASLYTSAVSALLPGNGFRIPEGSGKNAMLLPFALDEATWEALIHNGVGSDNFSRNPDTGAVSSGPDGILEVNLYPNGKDNLPPGNRGTVDIGPANNSTSDLARQILNGLNEDDLSYFANNEVKASPEEPLYLNGDTGISAGMKDELSTIRGQTRAIPIFREMPVGNGNNATYKIIKFVGVTVVDVKLTGNPKHLMVQPCPFVDSTVTWDTSGDPITEDTIFTTPVLIE